MARMFPNRIPDHVRTDPRRSAECTIYEALLETLTDEWAVFGWVAWILRRPGGEAVDGEADFVLAHPTRGVFVLEVKGGAISFDAVSGRWASTDMTGKVHGLKESPFAQARRNRYALARKLDETPGWSSDGVRFGYAVAFPDCELPAGDLGFEAPRELVISASQLGRMDEGIERIAEYWHSKEAASGTLDAARVDVLANLLAKSFNLRIPQGRFIAEDARQIIELTGAQFRVLDGLSRNRRLLVTGGAGTGKTLLALEKAKRLASVDGFRTLLTCFNRPLAEYLRSSAGDVPNLTVLNFHELCAERARAAGLHCPDLLSAGLSNEFYRSDLPGLLVDALASLPDRFDAIVLDEGQDFSPTDRAALELALADHETSVLYVFQDEAQGIYLDGTPWPETGMSICVLTENRRNTQAIHGVLTSLVGELGTIALGPRGEAPQFIRTTSARQQSQELSRVLHRLIREQSVPPGSIAILTSSRSAIPELAENGRIGAFEVTSEHEPDDHRVLIESVTRFKGLERDVVILVRLDPVSYLEFQALLYVGASRARALLIVIESDAIVSKFEAASA